MDDFDFKLIGVDEVEFAGYNSAGDKTTLNPNLMIRGSKNVYKTLQGTIATRPGLKRRGSVDTTEAGTKASFELSTNVGTERLLRVNNGKLEVESDIVSGGTYVWYELFDTVTLASLAGTYTRFVFDTWWDNNEKTDRLLMVRGDDQIRSWSGGMALVASGTATTITKQGSESWSELGFTTNATGTSGAIGSIEIDTATDSIGTGYAIGDFVTITGGGGSLGTVRVTAIGASDGATAIELVQAGNGYSTGTNLATSSGGGGTGLTVSIDSIIALNTEKKIIISGVEYSYTGGESTTTLVGVSPTAVGVTSGQVAIQSVVIYDNQPANNFKADFLKVINNQAWVGSYSSRLIYISADTDFTDFSNGGALVVGDPDVLVLDNLAKGIGVKDGKVAIFAGNNDLMIITPNSDLPTSQSQTPLSGGSSRLVIQKVEKKTLAGLTSALGHEFIGNIGEYLVWLDQKNRLQALGTFANVDTLKPVNLSLGVQKELSEDNFTGGHLRVIQDNDAETVYITAPNNARDWMYQIKNRIDETGQIITERIWQPPQIRGISRFAVINGVIYGHSNSHPQIYQVWDTSQYSDDHPSEQQIPYSCRAFFAYNSHGVREKLKSFDKVWFEGYMPTGTGLRSMIYYDYQGATDMRELVIGSDESPAEFWLGNNPPSLGDSSLGDNPLGEGIIPEGGDAELVPKFRSICDVGPIDNFEYAVEIYSNEVDARWELLCFGTNARESSSEPTFIRR